jgi:hypothetical protein
MTTPNCRCNDEYQAHLTQLAEHHRIAWRNALKSVTAPFVRLHRLRNIRTRMLHEALGDLDHHEARDTDA